MAVRLELPHNARFQRWEWRVQRAGWLLWTAILFAATIGLLGPGPLSRRTALSTDGQLAVQYDRFAHHHHPTLLRVEVCAAERSDDAVRLHLSQSLLDRVRIEAIEPEPEARELTPEGAWYVFPLARGAATASILYHLEHESIGSGSGFVRLAGGEPIVLQFFVYP